MKLVLVDMFGCSLKWPMTIAATLVLAQQLPALNATVFYSNLIFKQAGLPEGTVFAAVDTGIVSVLMTTETVWSVDHSKAKSLRFSIDWCCWNVVYFFGGVSISGLNDGVTAFVLLFATCSIPSQHRPNGFLCRKFPSET
ncbi:unnamed protein product [Haemonchus placei]|uniref:MFS domain-containing protein n=1 Tax=Haemonchus placei TaxID=6290 RepID=A0A0N4WL84_HAEPC|nr:unnamed protein product [Haemonchus placei]